MPHEERVVVVFVASPSDLSDERESLEEVVRELNLTWSQSLRVRLDLVRWETHAYPGIGQDPQDVVNHEMKGEPDIFIGMLWGRYGTPTRRAESGTEEEFLHALSRYRENPSSVRIMFYFKDAPIAPRLIDPDQLARVQKFQASLGEEGSLFWNFGTTGEFERLLRMHLSRQLQEFLRETAPLAPLSIQAAADHQPQNCTGEDDDLGLLEHLDLVDEHFDQLVKISEKIAAETSSLGTSMNSRTREIQEARAEGKGNISRREAKSLIERTADDMNLYAARMRAEIPLFSEALREGASSAAKTVLINVSIASGDRHEVQEAREGLVKFVDSLRETYASVDDFKKSVQDLPRMTASLNKAKRGTVEVLDDLLGSLSEGRRVAVETIMTLDALIGEAHEI